MTTTLLESPRYQNTNFRSRFRQTSYKDLVFARPKTEQANVENVYSVESQQNLPPEYKESYWFSIKENRQILKQIMDTLGQCSIQQDKNGYIYLIRQSGSYADTIFFPENFPQQAPMIKRRHSDNTVCELNVPWNYNGDIYNNFITYYNQTMDL